MKKTVSFLIFFFCLFQPSHSFAKDEAPFADAMGLLISDKQLSREDRRIVAEGLKNQCDQINDKIPGLSPSESRWLNSEIQAGRIEGLIFSVEAAKQQTKEVFGTCGVYADGLSAISSEDREVAGWSIIVREMVSPYLADRLEILRKKKLVNFSEAERAFGSMLGLIVHRILDRIVVPMLKEQIK